MSVVTLYENISGGVEAKYGVHCECISNAVRQLTTVVDEKTFDIIQNAPLPEAERVIRTLLNEA